MGPSTHSCFEKPALDWNLSSCSYYLMNSLQSWVMWPILMLWVPTLPGEEYNEGVIHRIAQWYENSNYLKRRWAAELSIEWIPTERSSSTVTVTHSFTGQRGISPFCWGAIVPAMEGEDHQIGIDHLCVCPGLNDQNPTYSWGSWVWWEQEESL